MADKDDKPQTPPDPRPQPPKEPDPHPAPAPEPAPESDQPPAAAGDEPVARDLPRGREHVIASDLRDTRVLRETVVVDRRSGFFMRWLKRILGLLLLLAILLAILLLGVSLVLRSEVPRTIAHRLASNALGLDVEMADLDIGWDGSISVSDLLVRLPEVEGEGQKLLEVPGLDIEVGPLPMVALNLLRGQQPDVRRVQVQSPTVYLLEDDEGQWNLVRAMSLLNMAQRPDPGAPERSGPPNLSPLPDLVVRDGRLVVRDREGQEAVVEDIELRGRRHSPLIYSLTGGAADSVRLSGELMPATGASQEIRLQLGNLPGLLQPVFPLPDAQADVTWLGALTDDGIAGVLEVRSASLDELQAAGTVEVELAGQTLRVQPRQLTAGPIPGDRGPLQILDGRLEATTEGLQIDNLLVEALGGSILVRTLEADWEQMQLQLDAEFQNLQPNPGSTITGVVQGSAGFNDFGQPRASLNLSAVGTLAAVGLQQIEARVLAAGPHYRDFRTLDVQVHLQEAPIVMGDERTILPRSTATFHVRLADPVRPRVELAQVRSLQPEVMRLDGRGVYYMADHPEGEAGRYWLWLEQRGFQVSLPRVEEAVPLDLGIVVRGRFSPDGSTIAPIEITHIYGSLADVFLDGHGWYVLERPPEEGGTPEPPLLLSLALWRHTPEVPPQTPAAREIIDRGQRLDRALIRPTPGVPEPPLHEQAREEYVQVTPIRGTIRSWLEIGGDPMAGTFTGSGGMMASQLGVGPYELGTVQAEVTLSLTPESLLVHTVNRDAPGDFVRILGSHMELKADIPFEPTQPGTINVAVRDMQVSRIIHAADLPEALADVQGELNGELHISLLGFSLANTIADGTFVLRRPIIPQAELADEVVIRPRLRNGVLDVPIEVHQSIAVAPGPTPFLDHRLLRLHARYDLEQPRQLNITNLEAAGFPLTLPAAEGRERVIQGELWVRSNRILVDFSGEEPQMRAQIRAALDVATGQEPFALEPLMHSTMAASANESELALEHLEASLPGIGSIVGGGTLRLADIPGRSQIWVHGRQIDLEGLATRLGLPEGAIGTADFSLTIAPGPGPRPRGEVLVNFAFQGHLARFRTVDLERGQILFYLSRVPRPDDSPVGGQWDFTLLTTERARIHLAHGVVDFYVKLRNRGAPPREGQEPALTTTLSRLLGRGEDWYLNATLDARQLRLVQLTELFEQEGDGRLDASLIAFGNLNQRPRFPGTEEETRIFPLHGEGTLSVRDGRLRRFNLFQRIIEIINVFGSPQRDYADARFRLEEGNFFLDSLVAFVDGGEIRMSGRLDDVFSPNLTYIEGSGVVFARPLSQIQLPFFGTLDEILVAMQTQATGFRVRGPLRDPIVRPAALGDIGEALRVLLRADAPRGP